MPFSVNDSTPEREAAAREYLQGNLRLSLVLRILCADGDVYGFTNAQEDRLLPDMTWRQLTIPQTLYTAGTATFTTNIQQSRDIRKDIESWQFMTFCGETEWDYVQTSDIIKNKFADAYYSLIIYARDAPYAWLRLTGEVGEIRPDKGQATWKMNSLSKRLRQDVIEVTSPVARAKWGDEVLSFFNLDGNTADGHAARVNGLVSNVDATWPRRRFKLAASAGFPEYRFTDGIATFLIGANAGYSGTIQNWSDDGTVQLDRYTPYPIANGDTVELQIRVPQTIEEWVLFFGDGKYFPAEPGIPGNEIANTVQKS